MFQLLAGNLELLLAALGVIGGAAAWLYARWTGVQSERRRQERRDARAAQDQLNMMHEGMESERDAQDLSDDEAREKAKKWSD